MTEPDNTANKRNIWVRGIYMLLMTFAFQLTATVLCVVAVIQFAIVLLNGSPNDRLIKLGRNLGLYLQQIANFLTYATEEIPFPFSDWPSETNS
jgi:hypothetical protein